MFLEVVFGVNLVLSQKFLVRDFPTRHDGCVTNLKSTLYTENDAKENNEIGHESDLPKIMQRTKAQPTCATSAAFSPVPRNLPGSPGVWLEQLSPLAHIPTTKSTSRNFLPLSYTYHSSGDHSPFHVSMPAQNQATVVRP